MGLEDREDPASGEALFCSLKRGDNLGQVVCVVVDDEHPGLATHRKRLDPCEAIQRLGDLVERHLARSPRQPLPTR